jgi:hypothetical protein
MTETPFIGHVEWATDLLEIIHTDVCSPLCVAMRGGFFYFITFNNDLSTYIWVYLFPEKKG